MLFDAAYLIFAFVVGVYLIVKGNGKYFKLFGRGMNGREADRTKPTECNRQNETDRMKQKKPPFGAAFHCVGMFNCVGHRVGMFRFT